MSFAPAFTVTIPQNPAPSTFVVTDTSVGSDVLIVDRQILIFQANGSLLVPAIDFPLSAGSSITLSPLTQDLAANIVVNWNYTNPVPPAYSTSLLWAFNQYGEQFFYSLIQNISSSPPTQILNDTNYLINLYTFRVLLNAAVKAVTTGSDQGGSQNCINLYNLMITNQANLF